MLMQHFLYTISFLTLLSIEIYSPIFAQDPDPAEQQGAEESEILSSDDTQNISQEAEAAPKEVATKMSEIPPIPDDKSESEEEGSIKSLGLKAVLEQGLRENHLERSRQIEKLMVELKQKGENERYWLPHIGFMVETSNHRVGTLYSGDNLRNTNSVPSGQVGLELGDYTVFNWGIDFLKHQNQVESYKRQQLTLDEERRSLKHRLVYLYFQIVKERSIEFLSQESVRHSTFLYRLCKEKVALQKLSKQSYFQIRTLYLLKQQEYNQARIQSDEAQKLLSHQLGDLPETLYRPTETLKYTALRLPQSEALLLYEKNNPYIKTKTLSFENASREYQWSKLENLPLPRFSINFGSYLTGFNGNGSNTTYDTSPSPGGRNLELRASIQMHWDLLGEKGFFNDRLKTYSFYGMNKAQVELAGAKNLIANQIRKIYKTINEQERQIEILEPLAKNGKKQFDETLNNYLENRSSFLELKDALNTQKESEALYETVKLQHLASKIELAELVGIEDLPGDYFENLGQKVE